MEIAIDAREIEKAYRSGVRALNGVSFQVGAGEIFGYLGSNGSGKTTTVRILTTLSRPTAGRAIVGGYDVIQDADSVRRMIGVTMQDAALDGHMTALEHLEFVSGLWGIERNEGRRRSGQLLETFGLAAAARRVISSYSGGMRRRLDIATALVAHPQVIFLDEPTTGLDPHNRRALWGEIRALRENGATVFLTTQYLEEADELADRLAVIERGKIVACGTPHELKAATGRTVVNFRLADNGNLNALRPLIGGAPFQIGADGLVRVELHDNGVSGSSAALGLLAGLRDRGLEVMGLSVSEPTLEEVFVQLIDKPRPANTPSLVCGPR